MLYPENLFNRVTYTYGKAGDKYNRAGRLALVEDASGGEAYYYGRQGEVTKTVRTVMASVVDIRTYVYGATYDSWNRVQTMTYPDGEVVTYHYNAAGQVESLTSNKQDAALGQYLVTRPNGLSYKITDELEDLQMTGIKSIFINSSKAQVGNHNLLKTF